MSIRSRWEAWAKAKAAKPVVEEEVAEEAPKPKKKVTAKKKAD